MDETNNSMEARLEGGMMLRTEGLIKRYGKRTVVNDVSITVRQGEIVGLLGPNGAGKTTSFYMTTGLIIPNAGHIYLDDKDITSFPVYKRARAGIGYLPQEASVFRKLSVEDNILAVLEMTDLTRKQQMEKLESLIKEFRLEKVRKNIGDRLSGGERRRTEIARCLAIDPKFIMLDEPFAGVDPIAVEDIQHIVWRLKYRNIGLARGTGREQGGAREVSYQQLRAAPEGLSAHRRGKARQGSRRGCGRRLTLAIQAIIIRFAKDGLSHSERPSFVV